MNIPELYKAISEWLNIENPTEAQILEGADLLRQILPNRKGLYNTIVRRPQTSLPLLTQLLRRHAVHLAVGLDIEGVAQMDAEVRATVTVGISVIKDEPPTLPDGDTPSRGRGLRPDHDQLPEKIQALWTKNAERWKKMQSLRNTCLGLSQPCDRFELLKELKDNWYAYKKDMKKYDDFRLTVNAPAGE